MNVITQFFRNTKEQLDVYLNNIERISKDPKIKAIFIFSDVRLHRDIKKVQVFRRETRLKWFNVFDFIQSNHINREGAYIIEADKQILKFHDSDGIIINNQYVYAKNIKKTYPIKRFIFEDYDFLKLKINGYRIKVASICHIYYEDMLEDMINKCKNLYKMDFDVDFYFTLTDASSTKGQKEWAINLIRATFPDAKILVVPNKGLDIGAFFKVLIDIINKDYDYVVKTHAKKSLKTSGEYFGKIWHKDLMGILDEDKLPSVYELMAKNSEMIASNKWIISKEKDGLNSDMINEILQKLKIDASNNYFVGGTMFWMRFEILKNNFNKELLEEYYNNLEDGYFFQVDNTHGEYLTHTFERIFGLMCKKIDGI